MHKCFSATLTFAIMTLVKKCVKLITPDKMSKFCQIESNNQTYKYVTDKNTSQNDMHVSVKLTKASNILNKSPFVFLLSST